jgi:hypothetical protein
LAWALLGVAAVMFSWSIASPLMSSPDEPSQVINATAVDRGELDRPPHTGPVGEVATVSVPSYIAGLANLPDCYVFKPTVGARCSPPVGDRDREVKAVTQFSNYPPLYFALTGIPTLLFTGSGAIYAMRWMAVLLNSALVALGLFLLARYHPRRLPMLGALVALSPMVFFITSVVNNSGMETAAGFATWCGALCLIEQERVPPSLAVWTGLAAFLLALSRPISFAYLAIIVLVVAIFAGWKQIKRLAMQWPVCIFVASLACFTTIALGFLTKDGQPILLGIPPKHSISLVAAAQETLGLTGTRLLQTVGKFGWLDTPVPIGVVIIWATAAIGLVLFALVISARSRRALPFFALLVVALTVVLESPRINSVGPYWQGRYWLPLLVGLPLLASSALRPKPLTADDRALHRRPLYFFGLGLVVIGGLFIGQLAAFLTALHRYEVGLGARPGSHPAWQPPGGSALVVALFVAGEVVLASFILWSIAPRARFRIRQPAED